MVDELTVQHLVAWLEGEVPDRDEEYRFTLFCKISDLVISDPKVIDYGWPMCREIVERN